MCSPCSACIHAHTPPPSLSFAVYSLLYTVASGPNKGKTAVVQRNVILREEGGKPLDHKSCLRDEDIIRNTKSAMNTAHLPPGVLLLLVSLAHLPLSSDVNQQRQRLLITLQGPQGTLPVQMLLPPMCVVKQGCKRIVGTAGASKLGKEVPTSPRMRLPGGPSEREHQCGITHAVQRTVQAGGWASALPAPHLSPLHPPKVLQSAPAAPSHPPQPPVLSPGQSRRGPSMAPPPSRAPLHTPPVAHMRQGSPGFAAALPGAASSGPSSRLTAADALLCLASTGQGSPATPGMMDAASPRSLPSRGHGVAGAAGWQGMASGSPHMRLGGVKRSRAVPPGWHPHAAWAEQAGAGRHLAHAQ